jgi:hypothetical protein
MMRPTHVRLPSAVSLRLANGECIVVTLGSWKKFLVRLENKTLTNESASTHTPVKSEGNGTDGILQTR